MSDITKILRGLTADATVLYQKLRHYHWNVKGEHFFGLHLKFEELYTRWAEIIDELAERTLMVGGQPPAILSEVLELATIDESANAPEALAMVGEVVKSLESIHASLSQGIDAAEERNDRPTANLLDGLRDEQEKTLWMLRAFLAK